MSKGQIAINIGYNTRRGSLLNFPSATGVSLCPGAPVVSQRSLNPIFRAKKEEGLIDTY